MFVETGKKFIESFAEIKNKKSIVFVIAVASQNERHQGIHVECSIF